MTLPFGRASDFEFRYRFWLIAAAFCVAFTLYAVDHQNAAGIFVSTRRGYHLVFAAAAMVVTLAGLLRTWAAAYLHSDVVHDLKLHSEKLVADGPFRFTRNPLYLGSLMLTIGIGMLASRLGWLIAVISMVILGCRLIAREESELLQSQGQRFVAYCAKVPRFFPSLWPRIPASGAAPKWKQALGGEAYFWAFAIGMIGFAITLDPRIPRWLFSGCFVLYTLHFLLRWMEKKDWIYYRRKRPASSSTRAVLGTMEAFIRPEIQYVKEDQGQREFEILDSDSRDNISSRRAEIDPPGSGGKTGRN